MAGREFIVLYTHQKKKKAKVWQDGVLKITDQGTKAVLIGEGNKRLDQVHIKANQAAIGEELESEKYLITIEENVSSDKPKAEAINLETSHANQPDQRPHSHAPRRQPLKRKRTGFVPPRQVNKRPSPEKENPPKTQESQPLSTSSGLGSPRSSLFSTPCSKTEVSLQHGPNILHMYGRNRVKASQSNAHFAASELHVQQAMRYGTSSDPHKLEEDVGSESQEWSEDYNHGTLSRQNAATGYLAHPLTRTVMGEDLGEQQVGNQPGKSTEMRGTWDDLEGGSELSRTDSVSIKSSLSTDPSSSFQELRRTSSKQDSYRMHMYLSASSVKPGTNPDTVETRLTEEANDKTGDAFGAKRSTSRILALLGKGKKPFQPPLKQKSTQDTISHSSTGLMEDPSSQAILRPQGPVHVHQDNHQARIISSQPVMVEKDKFDEPLSYNTESQEPNISPTISRVFDEGNAGRTVASIRTSQHHCIPGEHGHMRLNTTSDQATEGNPTEAAAYDLGKEKKVTKGQCESKKDQCNKCNSNTSTCKLLNRYLEEELSSNIVSYESDRNVNNTCRNAADVKEVAHHSSVRVVEQSVIECEEEEGNSQDHTMSDVYNLEESVSACTCKTECTCLSYLCRVKEELKIVLGVDNQEIKSSSPEKIPLLETETLHTAADTPEHSDSKSDAPCDEANETVRHQSLDFSQNVQSTTQNLQQRNLTGDISVKSSIMEASLQIDFDPIDVSADLTIEQGGSENHIDYFQTSPNLESVSDLGAVFEDKPEGDEALQIMHPVSFDTDETCTNSSYMYELGSFKNMTYIIQKSPSLKAVFDRGEDQNKPAGDDKQQNIHPVKTDNTCMDSSHEHAGFKKVTDVVPKSPSLKAVSDVGDDGYKPESGEAKHLTRPNITFVTDPVSLTLSCEEDESKSMIDTQQKSPKSPSFKLGSDVDDNGGKSLRKDTNHSIDPLDVDSGDMSLVSSCEQDGFTEMSYMFHRSPTPEAGFDLDGDTLLRNSAQKILHPVNTNLHKLNSELSETSEEAPSGLMSCNVESVLPDGNSQRSSVTSIDTLDFSQDTQIEKDSTLYFQEIHKGHYFKGTSDHSPVPNQDVDAVVPNMEYTETHHHSENLCGECDITEHVLFNKASSLLDPTSLTVVQEGEQSVPEIPDSGLHEIATVKKQEERDKICIGGKVSGEEFQSGQCTTPVQIVELSAQSSDSFDNEVHVHVDGNSNDSAPLSWSSNKDHQHFRNTHDKQCRIRIPLPGILIEDQSCSNTELYDSVNNYSERLSNLICTSPNQANGSLPLWQTLKGYELQQSTSSTMNATQDKSRIQPQLGSPAFMSSHMSHHEQLRSSTSKQCDGGYNSGERFQDGHSSNAASAILPHPSYLKSSVKRNATDKSFHSVSKDQGESSKEGIYWKQFVSSGTVRRCPLTPFQRAFQSRQDQSTPLEIQPMDTGRIQPYDTHPERTAQPSSPFDNLVKRHQQTPSQTASQPRQDLGTSKQMFPAHADRIPAYGSPASGIIRSIPPFGNLFSPAQDSPLNLTVEHCMASAATATTAEGLDLHSSNTSISNNRDYHGVSHLSERDFLEDGPSCNATSMQRWDTRMHQTHSPEVLDCSESQTGHNFHLFTLDEKLQDLYHMSQAKQSRLYNPTLPNSQLLSDIFTVNDSQSCLSQGNGRCRDQQLSQPPNLKSLECVNKETEVPSPDQDVMSLYPRRGEQCRNAVFEEKRYFGGFAYPRESPCDNMPTHREDARSTGLQFDSQPQSREKTWSDGQDLEVSQSASEKETSIGGMDGPLEAVSRHLSYKCPALHGSMYVHCCKGVDLASTSFPQLSSDDGLHTDDCTHQIQRDGQISNSTSTGKLKSHEVIYSRINTQQPSYYQEPDDLNACGIGTCKVNQNIEPEKLQSQPCASSSSEGGRRYSSGIDDGGLTELHESFINLERAQSPEFTPQKDDSVNVCYSPGESSKGPTLSPESISFSPGPCLMDRPGKQMDAVNRENDSLLREGTDTVEKSTPCVHSASTYLSKTSHTSKRKMTFKHRPLISKPTDDPNTPLPKIFHRAVADGKFLPSVGESWTSDPLPFESSHMYSMKTNISHKVSEDVEDHTDDCFSQVDLSSSDLRDRKSDTILNFESDGECLSPLHKQEDEVRHSGDQAMCSHNLDQHCSRAIITECEQGNTYVTPTTDLGYQLKKVGLKQRCGIPREYELALDMELVHGCRQYEQLKQEVHQSSSEDIVMDDAVCSGFHDKQVILQELENASVQEFSILTAEFSHTTENNALPNKNNEPRFQFRVGTTQENLGVGQIHLQGNVAGNAPSLHLYHTQQYRTQGGIGKSGTQTQSGDGLSRVICGRERSEMRKGFRTSVSMMSNMGMRCELNFPAADTVHSGIVPQRKIVIPVSFPGVSSYKEILTEAVKEHLNILLHELSHRYHSTMEKADITSYIKTAHGGNAAQMSGKWGNPQEGGGNPPCKHDQPTKMVCVKKDGPNKGRMFYVCNNQRENQCKFFVWADQHDAQASQVPTHPSQTRAKISLHNAESIEKFARTNQIHLYCESQLSRRGSLNEGLLGSAPAWVKKYRAQKANNTTKKLYIKLHRKEHSSTYAKDDLWIISQDLTFDPSSSFVAKSVFHGPSSSNEIEIEPLTGYSPSNWSAEGSVYGILACNASSELTCLDNLQEYVNPRTFPILPHLISCEPERNPSFHGPAFVKPSRSRHLNLPASLVRELVEDTIRLYHLNPDQSSALQQVASMVGGEDPPVTLIHGVFGAGKSYLLAVMVLLLVKLFKLSEDRETVGQENGWKVLIASTTNVAVDRILLGLLDLGFEDFIRVGSLRKIAKPVLPYSVHASDKENQEMKELQEMLKGDLTLSEKQHVRRSIERQRLGKNKEMLAKVKVIGVTCAACSFPCIKNLTFPVVLLDECSQMMEPSSLLPMARFGCEKLVLVGDPHQLDPTIQGSESAHKSGLEQTLFDRLSSMGYEPILLRTQYRCHPSISSLANTLFYDGQLLDGIIEEDRPPLLPNLPTLCFFNIPHGREMSARDGSYFNDPEANFVVFLISSMMEMGISPADVGVITLYKAQVRRIRMLLQTSSTQNSSELKAIQISTVDAFQGGEKSIIILSCVRTQRVGFIDSDKRTNVALTRSKNHLLIVGGMKMLSDNLLWGEIVHKCQEIPDGIQDSKVFQKQWEERLRELKEDADIEQERPQRTKAKRRKLERIEREHSPAMSLDSNDGDFVSSVSPSISCTTNDCMPVVSEMDCSEITRLHPTGTPHSCPEDDDLPHIDLGALHEDGELMSTARSKTDHVELPHSQEVLSTTAPVTFQSDPSACSPSSLSQEENDLPNIDLGALPKDDHVKWDASRKETFISKEVVFLGEKREPTETPEISFSYSPLQDVVESDSESSEEDLPNFDIGNILL